MRNVVITGAGAGLGRTLCETFRAAGDRVHICDVAEQADLPWLSAYSAEQVRYTKANVGNSSSLRAFFDDIAMWMPHVDVLVNNVGISGPRSVIEVVEDSQWSEIIDVNLLGAIRCISNVLPGMKARKAGVIANVSSSSVGTNPVNRAPYVVTKAAVEALTKSVAREVGPFGIRCNAVRPGMMNNERMTRILQRVAADAGISVDEVRKQELQFVSMRSMVEMQEVAQMILYLTSEHAVHVTGQVISVDGNHEWES
jgi:NAD(P)-dependent dehydrogenase (short-subunit alcohol dehydrogenase family)